MNKKKIKFNLLFILIPLCMVIPLYFYGKTKVKYFFGEFAYCLFIVDTVLGLRPQWIEKYIELKNIYSMHIYIAIFAIFLAFLHIDMSHLHGISKLLGFSAFYIAICVSIIAFIFLTDKLTDISLLKKLILKIRLLFKKFKFTRESSLLIHVIFAPLIVVFTFFHVILIHKFNHNLFFMMFFVLYFMVFLLNYIYFGVISKTNTSKYYVSSVKRINEQHFKIQLKYKKGKRINICSGKFIFIKLNFSKFNEYHPFSIMKSINNGQVIDLGIKKSGDFTKKLSQVKIGSIVNVKGVYGHFTYKKDDNPIIAIAGGIGITACIGLLQSLPKNNAAYLIWNVKSAKQIIFKDELNSLKETHPNIKIIYRDTSVSGHLTKIDLQEIIDTLIFNQSINQINYYICGPKGMVKQISMLLIDDFNVNSKNIVTEGFVF